MILDFAVSDAHPGLKTLALKSEHGFVKDDGKGGDDGSISMVPKDAKFGSRYVGRSIAFSFMSKYDLTLTSNSLADEYQIALWRFLLREENCWLQIRVHNFDIRSRTFLLGSLFAATTIAAADAGETSVANVNSQSQHSREFPE